MQQDWGKILKMLSEKKNIKTIISRYGIYIIFLVIFLVLSIANQAFFTPSNLLNILKQASTVAVIAIGQTLCLITGGMDLSSGSIMALAGVTSAMFGLADKTNMPAAFLTAILVGMLCGFINGLIVSKGRVPAFIATLGMQQAARGMALLVTNATPVFGLSAAYIFMGSGKVLGIPMLVIIMVAVVIVTAFILNKTKFGRHVYAVGGNEQSAHVSGIRVQRVKLIVYTAAGALAGLGGIMLAGRIQSGTPTMGEGYELDAIAGAVIGGVSTSGGVGTIYGAVIGSLLMAMISNGLDLMNVSAYYQQIIKGIIIVLAVLLDVQTKSSKK
ncbi:ABC transporter permease [Lactonifactor longoviformis]|uniref:Monosaccharide ABC transporter membrane protein, CUT2 family n=2 Tax=Lactonifactor TaxID=420345 RepID=A0A1M5ABD6_9CLOT|nr:ABC transporter permease [Lactonifactor longoviformis]POP34662.1 ABC transporter permease [Lactonifactor longoviformis]SHF27610.1 monosaccharide ABC transporter membrane protein, CUT2 family [Lactonifactor longoviformis DSM 17459]